MKRFLEEAYSPEVMAGEADCTPLSPQSVAFLIGVGCGADAEAERLREKLAEYDGARDELASLRRMNDEVFRVNSWLESERVPKLEAQLLRSLRIREKLVAKIHAQQRQIGDLRAEIGNAWSLVWNTLQSMGQDPDETADLDTLLDRLVSNADDDRAESRRLLVAFGQARDEALALAEERHPDEPAPSYDFSDAERNPYTRPDTDPGPVATQANVLLARIEAAKREPKT